MTNRLANETSPYLLQHADNPVHWWPWGEDALNKAKREDKPVLLSVGYAACHWCHVMAHESFEDAETAKVMNDLFVNIKVDREERPDLDAVYQRALMLMGEHGGWPLTMFLTPEGKPFWGGTYFPKDAMYGRPGFKDVLRHIYEVYRSKPEAVKQNQQALTRALQSLSALKKPEETSDEVFAGVTRLLLTQMDPVNGGTMGAPKFPNAPVLELLWRAHLRGLGEEHGRAVLKALRHMCQGGIYDHLGGGFCRYSTDAQWLVPHFEKMLYDNAMLLELLADVCAETGEPLFTARMEETAGWLLREMQTGDGAFASALDADSEGEEGRYYVWDKAEIDRALGKDSKVFCEAYGVTKHGNWEGRNVLNRLAEAEAFDQREDRRLAPRRAKLLKIRNKRPRPLLDDKVLADWNGLAIAALARAAAVSGRAEWLKAAEGAFAFVAETMSKNGRLSHSWRKGKARGAGLLDDYAFMTHAALALYRETGREKYRGQAEAWLKAAEHELADKDFSGFYMAPAADDLIARPRTIESHPAPSGNGVMIENYAVLHRLTGNRRYLERAEALLRAFAREAREAPFGAAAFFSGFDTCRRGVHVLIRGKPDSPKAKALAGAARALALPGLSLSIGSAKAVSGAPEVEQAARALEENQALACLPGTCSLPQSSPDKLKQTLLEMRRGAQTGG